jgi:WD40 repeat protein
MCSIDSHRAILTMLITLSFSFVITSVLASASVTTNTQSPPQYSFPQTKPTDSKKEQANPETQHDSCRERAILCLAFSTDGKQVAAGSRDGTVTAWDVATAKPLSSFASDRQHLLCLSYSPDGEMLATGHGRDPADVKSMGRVHLWSAKTAKLLQKFDAHGGAVYALAFSLNGNNLATVGSDNHVRVWELATGKEIRRFTHRDPGERYRTVAYSPDGAALLAADSRGELFLWSLESASKTAFLSLPRQVGAPLVTSFTLGGKEVVSVKHSDQGIVLQVWDLKSEDNRFHLSKTMFSRQVHPNQQGSSNRTECCALSRDGKFLSIDGPRGIILLDLAREKEMLPLSGHGARTSALVFSADGKTLACGFEDGAVLLWDGPCAILDTWWSELGGTRATVAAQAFEAVVAMPADAVPYLKGRLEQGSETEKQVRRLLLDLDASRFDTREKATSQLERLGELAEFALRQLLAERPSLEVRARLQRILNRLPRSRDDSSIGADAAPEGRRILRAFEALERIGTPTAQHAVRSLAGGEPGAWLTRQASESLKRFANPP